MTKTLILFTTTLLVLISLSQGLKTTPSGSGLPFLQAYANSNGIIVLKDNKSGLSLQVDLADHSKEAGKEGSTDTIFVELALYTSDSFLVRKCIGFSSIPETKYPKAEGEVNDYNEDLPYFHVSGRFVQAEIYLDYSHWMFKDFKTAVIAEDCTGDKDATYYGKGNYGLVGMGVDADGKKNYKNVKSFALYRDQLDANFKLQFNPTAKGVKGDGYYLEANLATDEHWRVIKDVTAINFGKTPYEPKKEIKILFDINADAIGLPKDVYDQIIKNLRAMKVNCPENVNYRPDCPCTDMQGDLPNITISVGDQTIILTPDLYIRNEDRNTASSYTLNFKAIGHDLKNESYVTEPFNDYIILERHVLDTHYAVFDVETNHIQLYGYNDPAFEPFVDPNAKNDSKLKYYIIAAVVVAILIVGAFFLYRKRQADKLRKGLEDGNNSLLEH